MVLGFFAVCSTILSGIPAIILGYRAINEIDGDPGRFDGRSMAISGIVFGWIGCAFFCLFAGLKISAASSGAGVVTLALGVLSSVGAVALARKRSWTAASTVALVASPVCLLAGGAIGLGAKRAADASSADACRLEIGEAGTRLAAKDFAAARFAVTRAHVDCAETNAVSLAELDQSIAQQALAAQQADAARADAEKAAALAARESDAVASFPQKALEITALYKQATQQMYSGQWADSGASLDRAEAELSSFDGTSVTARNEWIDLRRKVEALQDKIQPQLDRLAELETKRAAAAQARAAEAQARAAAAAAGGGSGGSGSGGGCSCRDGSSGCCGRGCCSHHGGVAR